MKIKKLSATFGKLQKQTLELQEGLNIIEAPNESGKSTWAAFLRAMLYGIDTRERDRKGFIAEKNLYQPWDGGAMEGAMELEWGGRDITLRRTSRGNSPLSQFQAVYTGTEEPVPGLTGERAGEMLTGVGREVYERSAFVGQSAISVTGSAEMERRISAIVSSGQEDVSYSEAEQRLRDWKNRRQSNQKNGLIPRLEEEKAAAAATLERLERANRQACDARVRIRELERQQRELERQARAHRALAAARIKERYDAAKAELDAAESALNAVREERRRRGTAPDEQTLRGMQGELAYLNTLDANIKLARREIEITELPPLEIPHPVFAGMEPPAVRARAQADAGVLTRRNRWTPLMFGGLACLCILPVQIFLCGRPLLCTVLSALCAAAFALGVVLFLSGLKKQNRQKSVLAAAYGTREPDEIVRQGEEYIARWETVSRAHTEAAVRAVSLERLEAEREELAERLLDAIRPFAPEVRDLFGLSAAISLALNLEEKERSAALRLESTEKVYQAVAAQGVPEEVPPAEEVPQLDEQSVLSRLNTVRAELARCSEALAMAQGEMNTLGDPAALDARLEKAENQLTRRREEYNAILAAMEGLDEANAMLQERMSPALNARAGELLRQLTGGEYDQVSLTREFEALAGKTGDVSPHRLLTLSKGTADQLYLAVRLAVCDLVLSGDEPAPLVLDDALVNFDDGRLELALDLLRKLARGRQILLFTCQGRERRYLEEDPQIRIMRLQS